MECRTFASQVANDYKKGAKMKAHEDWSDKLYPCLLYTSDAADERSSVDLGGRRIIKKKKSWRHEEDSRKKQK